MQLSSSSSPQPDVHAMTPAPMNRINKVQHSTRKFSMVFILSPVQIVFVIRTMNPVTQKSNTEQTKNQFPVQMFMVLSMSAFSRKFPPAGLALPSDFR
jgi:hypothetical protein